MNVQFCHCGKPLHYKYKASQEAVERQIDQLGENVVVTIGQRSWSVPRHYIALHGLRGFDVETLGFEEITVKQQ